MYKFLIIGSKGFIGTHLSAHLESSGYEVWGADVIVDYETTHQYHLIDASNPGFHEVFKSESYDICINCSGAANVSDSLKHPHRDFQLNTSIVFKLLEAIRVYQPGCKFINLSSAAVYGNPQSLPIQENSALEPISPYGYHKLMSERICEEFHRFFGLNTCSLRIFSAYGEGLRKQLFWDLFQKAKQNDEITLYGTGHESRDFIYIDDLIQAIMAAAINTKCAGQSINVANGREVYIKDCVEIFYGLFEKPVNFQFSQQVKKGDPNNWVADISTLKDLGYKQKYSLEEGLKNYYRWIRSIA
ncbi:MAG: NAD-dependent epimerase/dehydratase family protein [Bacteroidales bacterium]|nr:NAD-dependent epimerase/dehydratase family protein [Bacteroidales bacterium]